MNLPPGAAREGGGVTSVQHQCVAGVGNRMVGFANDLTINTHAARQNPLLGTVLRRVGVLPQQPIQQGMDVRFSPNSGHLAFPANRLAFGYVPIS